MKTNIFILLIVLVLFCFLLKIGNGMFEVTLVTAIVAIIAWISYVCSTNKKIVFASLFIILLETMLYHLYEANYVEEICMEEQIFFVIKWCFFNFILAIIARFIPRIRELNTVFWMNGIVCPILFIYCAAHLD